MKPVNLETNNHRDEIRDEIKQRLKCRDYLQVAENGGYICPICGSGTHEKKTGAVVVNSNNSWWCYACMTKGRDKPKDVIELIQIVHGTDYSGALEIGAAAALLPNAPEHPRNDYKTANRENTADKKKTPQEATETPKTTIDRLPYYKQCMARLSDPAAVQYLNRRGISLETARRYYLGYDPKSDPAESGYPTPRIIIPTSRAHYVGRSIDPHTPVKYQKLNVKGVTPGVFNEAALHRPGIIFLTEGAFDALSVCEVGGEAIATNSANEAGQFIERLKNKPPAARLIVCKDNDPETEPGKETPGDKWHRIITEGLAELGIYFLSANISGTAKDANEALQKDRETFTAAVNNALQKAGELWKL